MNRRRQAEKVVAVGVAQQERHENSRLFFLFTAAQVEEVLPEISTRSVPFAPSFLEGLTLWRGHLLPVVDLEKCLGIDSGPKDDTGRFLVVRCGAPQNPAGRQVLHCMLHLSGEIKPTEMTGSMTMVDSEGIGVDPSLVRGIYQWQDDSFIVPDLVSILQNNHSADSE